MSRFRVTSTEGHVPYDEDYNGTIDEFIRFKFGSVHGMRDVGQDVAEVEAPVVAIEDVPVESKSATKRKKAME